MAGLSFLEWAGKFSFSKCQIPVGAKIEYYDNADITAVAAVWMVQSTAP